MATTSLWRIKGELGKVVRYAENPEKTDNPAYPKNEDDMSEQEQWLTDVINYAVQSRKTQCADERAEIMRRFVTGIHCMPETARNEMMSTKALFGKPGGVIAYHGFQSFAPGEATPEIAHEISVKLAQRLWGNRHEVVVATHLDKANHLHSHFVLNTVSFVDGKKFYRSEQDYYLMQKESDALCHEYGLSVIEEPNCGKSKHYAEWQADKNGHPTWRSLVKSDVDTAVRQSMTERQFWDNLKKQGYEIKMGKDISVRPPGKERFVRLRRNFGEDYDIEAIRRRILAHTHPERRVISATRVSKKMRMSGKYHSARKITGLRALYFYYLYRIGALPKKRKTNPKSVYFLFREDIRHVQRISQQAQLLAKHSIQNETELASFHDGLTQQIQALSSRRKGLRTQLRTLKSEDQRTSVQSGIAALSDQIAAVRKEVRLCEDIAVRSGVMRDKLQQARKSDTRNRKDVRKDDPFRGCR